MTHSINNKLFGIMRFATHQNTDVDHRSFWFDVKNNYAYGGHRRAWGVGDMLVRYMGPVESTFVQDYGVFSFDSNTFHPYEYLPGQRTEDGGRAMFTPEDCEKAFNDVYEAVKDYHQLVLNPKAVIEFIKERIGRDTMHERVINIFPFTGIHKNGQFAAQIDEFNGEPVIAFLKDNRRIPIRIDTRNSIINVTQLKLGTWIIVEPHSIVDGERYVRALRRYTPGIRMGIQYYKNGTRMPDDSKFSVIPGEDRNNMSMHDVADFPFFKPEQEMSNLKEAPMLTIQLDTFYRSMVSLAGYSKVELLYKNSFTPCLLAPFVEENEPVVQVILSALSPYVLGKVVTI